MDLLPWIFLRWPGFPSSKPGLMWMEFPWIILLAYIQPGLFIPLRTWSKQYYSLDIEHGLFTEPPQWIFAWTILSCYALLTNLRNLKQPLPELQSGHWLERIRPCKPLLVIAWKVMLILDPGHPWIMKILKSISLAMIYPSWLDWWCTLTGNMLAPKPLLESVQRVTILPPRIILISSTSDLACSTITWLWCVCNRKTHNPQVR